MNLNFILGRAASGKTYYIYQKIKERIDAGSEKIILLVPEQFTLQAEADLITKMNLPGIMNVQVLSFRRLAFRVLSEVGGIKKDVITDLGKMMILRKIFEDNKEALKIFTKGYTQDGFLKEISSFLSELKRNGISEEDLREKLKGFDKEDILKNKLTDISMVYQKYVEVMSGKYIDEDETLNLLSEKIESSSFLKDTELWIDGFNSFSVQEYKILEKLLMKCKEATVTLTSNTNSKARDYDLFEPTENTYRRLLKICDKKSISAKIIDIEERKIPNKDIAHLEKNLYSFPMQKYNEDNSSIKIFSAMNQYREVEDAAVKIIDLVRDNDYRWNDIAVVTNDLGIYSPIVKRVFSEYEIPVFIDEKRNIMSNPMINYIKSAIRIIINDYRYEDVFQYLKTGLTDLDKNEYEKLENYVLEYGIKGKGWKKGFNYISHIERTENFELLIELNRLREIMIQPLEKLAKKINRKGLTRNIAESLYEFLVDTKINKKIEIMLEEEKHLGNFEFVNENSQIWNIIIEVLDQVVGILGDVEIKPIDFLKIIETGFGNYELGLIPPTMDQVLVGNLERSKSHDIKALFLLGVNDGIIPRTFSDNGLILDDEKKVMQEFGFEIYSDNTSKLKEEKFSVYSALTKPTEKLFISYSIGDLEGKALRPSILVDRLKKLFDIQIEGDLDSSPEEFYQKVSRPVPAFKFLLENLRKNLDYGNMDQRWWNVYRWYFDEKIWESRRKLMIAGLFHENQVKNLTKGSIDKAYNSKESYSISRLETYANCPFKHFVKYGLRPKERKEYQVALPDIGTLFHNALEIFPQKLQEEHLSWQETDKNKAEYLMEDIIEKMSSEFQNGLLDSSSRNKYLKEKLSRVSKRAIGTLTEQLQKGEFKPWKYELAFKEFLNDDENILIEGRIDRLDICKKEDETYLRVIDYKSGSKKFNLQELYYLIQLQLIIYLIGAVSGSEKIFGEKGKPAGAFYFIIDDPMIEDKEKDKEIIEERIRQELKMDGFLLKDLDILKAMDNGIENGGTSDIIPVKLKNDGDFYSNSPVFAEDELGLLIKYVKNKIKMLVKEIVQGKIRIEPCKSYNYVSCTYCEYKSVCQFDTAFPDNEYNLLKRIKKDEIMAIIKEEVENDAKMDS